jgi:hypothetical protein
MAIDVRDNIELSCAAASPARSEPQQRHSYEKEDHLRRQLQRFVMTRPVKTGATASASALRESAARAKDGEGV